MRIASNWEKSEKQTCCICNRATKIHRNRAETITNYTVNDLILRWLKKKDQQTLRIIGNLSVWLENHLCGFFFVLSQNTKSLPSKYKSIMLEHYLEDTWTFSIYAIVSYHAYLSRFHLDFSIDRWPSPNNYDYNLIINTSSGAKPLLFPWVIQQCVDQCAFGQYRLNTERPSCACPSVFRPGGINEIQVPKIKPYQNNKIWFTPKVAVLLMIGMLIVEGFILHFNSIAHETCIPQCVCGWRAIIFISFKYQLHARVSRIECDQNRTAQ